jgi:hypothetical protein
MHGKATEGFRAVATVWFVLSVVWASAPASSAADECELPNSAGGWVLPTSRFEEFRITLNPPDYGNADAVRRHFVFSSVWADTLRSELGARSKSGCELMVDPHIFPDLRAFLIGYRSARGQTDFFAAVCVPVFREIVLNWTPDEVALAKAVVDLTRQGKSGVWAKGSAISSVSHAYEFSENLLRSALARIYDEKSVMHALASVDATSYRMLAAGPFLEWIVQQRSGKLGIAPLSLCPTAIPRTSTGLPMSLHKRRIPVFPQSATAPAGVIAIPYGEGGKDLPTALQHVVIIGDARPREAKPAGFYSMSPYARAVDRKYCGQRHVLDLGDEPARPASISISLKCQFTTILAFDDWMLLFCENCDSARAAEAVAKLVVDDPELRAINRSETDMKIKGPYLISVTASGK